VPSDRTIESIRLQSCDALERSTVFDCGCHLRHADERWSLCVYHEGYDDASEKTDDLQAKIDTWVKTFLALHIAAEQFNEAGEALLPAATPQEDDCG
jgi:hypothetical protein